MDSGAEGTRGSAVEQFADWLESRGGPRAIDFDQLLEAHPHWADELRELHGSWLLLAQASEPSDDALRVHPPGRYRIEGEVARGGMGAILRVFDADLRRTLAMKVALVGGGGATATSSQRGEAARLQRFLEEARVTGQLDHPGIVPVHELGQDAEGRHYFTMKLVEGRDLKKIFELVFDQREGWNQTRALAVVEKVCEAMAYAHQKGIIHRDLKPANIMVGSFGEVYVMDWGLSRMLRGADLHELRLAAVAGPVAARGEESAAPSESLRLRTMDGTVLGTPAYMPPEQANGDVERLTARSDIYSTGAMLYHLLAQRVPYSDSGRQMPPHEVIERVRTGPPAALLQCNPRVPAELVAICERAMARDPSQRYPDMLAFAGDLRAYLEHRVVAAYETGAVAELRKWIGRNRALAGAILAAIVILIVAVVVSSSLFVMARAETHRADAKAIEADEQRRIAARRADDVLSLSAGKDLQDLVERADALWPASPDNIGEYERWLLDARVLIDGRPADIEHGVSGRRGLADHRKKLAELVARALPPDAAEGTKIRFASVEDAWWYSQLGQLVADLEAFADPVSGLCSAGASPRHGWGVQRRLEEARTLAIRSVTGPEAAPRWQEAIASIADPARCPKYQGLRITPQLGLIPIGRDASSGLWEFAHLPTGEPAATGPDGAIVMHEGAGLVFVLVPGGTFWMGAQNRDPAGRNYDPMALPIEAPVHEVTLDPFFLSKFEMTQDQWQRFTGGNPSLYGPGSTFAGERTTLLHPVEQVSGRTAITVLQRLDLVLPTEAQWERAARGGGDTRWWTGSELETLRGAVNLADAFAKSHGGPSVWRYEAWLDDGRPVHAPVGRYRANGFGLYDVCGNVFELCREPYGPYGLPERAGDGERQGNTAKGHIIRGGGFHSGAGSVRSAFRTDISTTYFDFATGLRPARRVTG